MPENHEWALQLRSKYGGDIRLMGDRWDTREEAQAHATDQFFCTRCNYIDVVAVEKGRSGEPSSSHP